MIYFPTLTLDPPSRNSKSINRCLLLLPPHTFFLTTTYSLFDTVKSVRLNMAKGNKEESQDDGNLLSVLMAQASDLDFTDPHSEDPQKEKEQDPRRLIVEGFE